MLIENIVDKPSEMKDNLIINVGGVRHKTLWSTLEKIPGTRLSMMAEAREKDDSYDSETEEYYFDRNSDAFVSILEYYRFVKPFC